jgi:hypothetical protein
MLTFLNSWVSEMNIEAFDWNVVVIGFWNRAILNPGGIGKRLFGLEEGTPIVVEIPLNMLGSPRVKYKDLAVVVDQQSLTIMSERLTYEGLNHAREIAVKAINSLPETPLTATGFNFRFKIDQPTGDLLNATKSKIDELLSDADFEIKERNVKRSVVWSGGVINLSITHKENVVVGLNFHRQSSNKNELVTWLEYPISDVKATVEKMFADVIKAPLGEIGGK